MIFPGKTSIISLVISVTLFSVTNGQQTCPSSCGLDGRITALENQIRNLNFQLGWSLVFRVSSGYNASIYEAWSRSGPINEDRVAATDLSMAFDGVYRSSLVDHFHHLRIDQIKVSIFVGGEEKVFFIFDGRGLKGDSWFSPETHLDSPYGSLRSESFNFFSIPGDERLARPFFVSRNYGGCPKDTAWLAVADIQNNVCEWQRKHEGVIFLYCPDRAPCLLQSEAVIGDTFAVFIKMKS